MSHKLGGRLPLLSARSAVTPATLKRVATNFAAWWTEGQWVWTVCLRLLPTASRLRFEPGPSAPESSTLTTRLPSHPYSLTTWHCRHSPAAATAHDRYLLSAGPTAANLQQRRAAAEWDRQTDGRTDDRCIDPAARYAGSADKLFGSLCKRTP